MHSSSVGVFVNLLRSTWGFIGPFWFPAMFTSLGAAGAAGLMVGVVFAVSVLPIMAIQFLGEKWRARGL
jgi:hypothetical protein